MTSMTLFLRWFHVCLFSERYRKHIFHKSNRIVPIVWNWFQNKKQQQKTNKIYLLGSHE